MTALTFALIGAGIWQWTASKPDEAQKRGGASERIFKVRSGILQPTSIAPQIETFGRMKSWRRAPISSAASGKVIWISDNFRDGALIDAGQLLIQIDPIDAQLTLAEAENALAEAKAREIESKERQTFAKADLDAATTMLSLRERQWQRQQNLAGSGSTSKAAMDNVQMELVTAEQSLASRKLALVQAQNEATMAELAIDRAEIAQSRAERDVADTDIKAPFDGVLGRVDVAIAQELSANSVIGELIDLDALEVEIELSPAALSRLLDDDGRLRQQPLTITQKSAGIELEASGQLQRAGAEVAASGSGRVIFATLDQAERSPFRPGDFVRVRIDEPVMHNVAIIPSQALDDQNQILVINENNRLIDLNVTVLAKLADNVIVGDVPFGSVYVAARLPQLSAGVKVEIAQQPALDGVSSLQSPANDG